MDFVKEWWFIILPAAGLVMAFIRWLLGHNRDHQEMKAHIARSKESEERNSKDHKRIERKVDATLHGMKELLVREGFREPGQSINGEDE